MYKQLRPPTASILTTTFSILKIKYPEIFNNSPKVLDLFAGTGSFGLMMLSKADNSYCIFVEKEFSSCIKLEKIGRIKYQRRFKVIRSDVFRTNINMKFDIVFIDPPYNFNMSNKVLEIVEKQPWVTENTLVFLRKHINEVLTYDGKMEIVHEHIKGYNQSLFLKLKTKD